MAKIKRALISVSDKTDLTDFAKKLSKLKIEILSTGGTAQFLKNNDIKITDVSSVTNFPEILDGRVKTLHPVIHAGILARRDIAKRKVYSRRAPCWLDCLQKQNSCIQNLAGMRKR